MRVQWAPPAQEALPAKRFGSLGPVGRKLETKRKLTCLLCCARSSRTLRRRPRQQQRQLPHDEGKNAPGNADAARRGYSFQPSRDVDTVAIEVVGIDENIADIDADAEIHSAAFVGLSIADAQFLLDRNCTAHRFYR
jgi:hypothetical protein